MSRHIIDVLAIIISINYVLTNNKQQSPKDSIILV